MIPFSVSYRCYVVDWFSYCKCAYLGNGQAVIKLEM